MMSVSSGLMELPYWPVLSKIPSPIPLPMLLHGIDNRIRGFTIAVHTKILRVGQLAWVASEPHTNVVVRTSSETPGTYDDYYEELVPGSGNYLYIDANVSSASGGKLTIARDFGGESGIDRTQPYSIEFLYRIEEDTLASHFTTGDDQYQIYDYPTLRQGTTLGIGWGVKASGSNNIWRFFNGDGRNGTTNSVYVESGIPLLADHLYKFEISVDPVNSSWDGKVTDLTTGQWGGGTDMGYRFDSTGTPPATPSTLMQFHVRGDEGNDERQFSIDALKINQPSCSWTVGGMNEVAAHFNDGETTDFVDGFGGKAGDGWNGPWSKYENHAALTTTVRSESDNPLHAGDGNYLEMISDCSVIGSSAYAIGGVTRDYARVNEDGIDWTKDYTIFLCPTQGDTRTQHFRVSGTTKEQYQGQDPYTIHYQAVAGPTPTETENYPVDPDTGNGVLATGGVIYRDSEVSVKDVTDGTSKTYLLGELSWEKSNVFRLWTRGCTSLDCASSKNMAYGLNLGEYATYMNGSFNNCGFGSDHPDGANFTMADGSVRFVSEDTFLGILKKTASRDEGEIPEEL